MMRRELLILTLVAGWAIRAAAQQALGSPLGLWRTFDDHTGKERAEVRIFAQGGVLYGRIERVLDPNPAHRTCDDCTDDRRGKPIVGLEIIRGLRQDGDAWRGGEILDPENGKTYRASMWLEDGGRKLVVRGSILGGLIGRSQTWLRAEPH